MNTQVLLPALIMVHFYLCVRFAVRACFKYSSVYSFSYMALVALLPVAGYFIAESKLNRQLEQ
uniref:hypothetical protein n=1 Tax=Pedobacter schmidteae TaxID=2201271 RepID=UPI0013CF26DB|nr:hypothetical protein [Pedobacter schmidteae]